MTQVCCPSFREANEAVSELHRVALHVRDGWDCTALFTGFSARSFAPSWRDGIATLAEDVQGHVIQRTIQCYSLVDDATQVAATFGKKSSASYSTQADPLWGPFVKSADGSQQPWHKFTHTTVSEVARWCQAQGDAPLVIVLRCSRCAPNETEADLRIGVLTIIVDPQPVLRSVAKTLKARRQQSSWTGLPLALFAPVFQKQVHSTSFLGCSPALSVVGDVDDGIRRSLERIQISTRQRSSRGTVAIRGIRTDIERMRKMVVAAGNGPEAALTQQLLLEQIADAEAAVGPLQQLLDAGRLAAATDREEAAASAASRLAAQKHRAESLAADSALKLSVEKQRVFAQAFRSAFLVDREAQSRRQQEEVLAEQIRALRERSDRLELQQVAIKGERDRFQYDGLRTAKELRRVKSQLDDAHAANLRQQEALAGAQEECDALATKISLARFESTAEIHELRAHSLAVERERDAIELKNEALLDEIKQLRRALDDAGRDAKSEVQRQIEGIRLELSAERAKRLSSERRIEELETDCSELRQRIASDRTDLADALRRVDEVADKAADERKSAKNRLRGLLSQHKNERASYCALLQEAKESIREMQRVEEFRHSRGDKDASLYRGGAAAVRNWLEINGMERYASSLVNAGFDDIVSLANVSEADLVTLKVLTGHRRKLLSLTSSLCDQVRSNDIQSANRRDTTAAQLVDRLSQWASDFEATLNIEGEVDSVPE